MIENFLHKARALELLEKPVVVATSGGADSTALCFLCKCADIDFTPVIVDHGWRKNSAAEAKRVKAYLEKELGVEVIILTNKKKVPESNIEEFLRDVRLELIFNYCVKNNIYTVLTGHHLDDQIETFLMRLERGAGIDGLCGIKESSQFSVPDPQKKINVVRPLLAYKKEELVALLKKNKMKWVEDPSNKNTKLTRNNIRATLEKFSGYDQLTKRLSTVIENLSRATDFINREKEKVIKNCVKITRTGVTLDLNKYKKLHDEIRLRILRDIIKQHSKTAKEVRINSIKNLDKSLLDKKFKAISLHGINIYLRSELIIFE